MVLGLMVASAAAISLVGCGGSDAPAESSGPYTKSLEEACAAGAEEGQVDSWSASDPEQFAAEVKPFQDAYPDIKVNFTSLRPDEVTQRIITESQTGQGISADATTADLPSAEPLLQQGLIGDVDYAKLGIAENLIADGGNGVDIFRVFRDPLGIAYNPEKTPVESLPKTWD